LTVSRARSLDEERNGDELELSPSALLREEAPVVADRRRSADPASAPLGHRHGFVTARDDDDCDILPASFLGEITFDQSDLL
jgi:hypothetical protein